MRWLKSAAALLLALGLIGGGAAYYGWQRLNTYMEAPGPNRQETAVLLPRGASLQAIVATLEERDVLTNGAWFRIYVRLNNRDRLLKAGEYSFPPRVTPNGVLELLESGKTMAHRLTIAEGLTVPQIYQILERNEVLVGALPEPPAEGSLMPETYFFVRGDTRKAMVQRMQASMQEAIDEMWPDRQPELPFETIEEAITLASIVERETLVNDEDPEVAGVFVNRLRRGIRLQSDPTVIYAVTDGTGDLEGPIRQSHLRHESPYNTYLVEGLPPGPIGNPGRSAIAATLNPAETENLFFVADGTGRHRFAKTNEEHAANVRHWRRIERGEVRPEPVKPKRRPPDEAEPVSSSAATDDPPEPAASTP
ncbi:MAG: endolytic transglycosylase MltG [Geminicoccaceae bacterium]